MTDDITTLLRRAAPTTVGDLDLDRAQREGRSRARRRTGVTVATAVAAVASATVVASSWPIETAVTVGPAPEGTDLAAEQAAAGCLSVPAGDPDAGDHFDAVTAPPAEALYDVALPSAGDHLAAVSDVPDGVAEVPLDVRAVVHNLEHGAVAIWLDTDQLPADVVDDIATWANTRRAQGFAQDQGASVIASPVPQGLHDVAPVSLRAWGVAMDCSNWSTAVADGFVAAHYGSRGSAPEGFLAPYPSSEPLG